MANNLKPIQIKLKEAIRKTSFMKNRHPNVLFKQHKVLNFEKQETLVHETFWNICMIYVECYKWRGRKYYHRTTSIKRQNLCNKNYYYSNKKHEFYIPSARSNLLKRNIIYQGPKLWNSITVETCSKKSIQTFEIAYLKKLLICKYTLQAHFFSSSSILTYQSKILSPSLIVPSKEDTRSWQAPSDNSKLFLQNQYLVLVFWTVEFRL